VHAALTRLASAPMSREEALGMRGYGWDGDLASMRSGIGIDDE